MAAFKWTALLVLAGALACSGDEESADPAAEIVYVDQIEGLRGLQAIHLHTGFLSIGGEMTIDADLRDAVQERLESAGLRLIDEEEFQESPGLPDMQIYPSLDGRDDPEPDTEAGEENDRRSCCRARVWVSVIAGASLERDPEIHRLLPVWGGGSDRLCSSEPVDVSDLVLGVVDRFAADVVRANAEDPEAEAGSG